MLASGVVNGIFSRTIKPLLHSCITKCTNTPYRYIYDIDTSIHITDTQLSQVVCRAENLQAFCKALGKHRGSRIQPLPGRWDSLGTREVTQGAPGTHCPLHGSESATPCSVPQFPVSAAWLSPRAVPGSHRGRWQCGRALWLQYRVGQLYTISKHSHQESEKGEGVEVVKNEPHEDPVHGPGQFTEKRVHLSR